MLQGHFAVTYLNRDGSPAINLDCFQSCYKSGTILTVGGGPLICRKACFVKPTQ